jgi:hypothetical protein
VSRPVPRPAPVAAENAFSRWAVCTACAAILVSAADAALLYRKHGMFTGGFLSVEHLDTAGERVAFAVLSLVSDAALLGVLIALGFVLAKAWRLRATAGRILALSVAVTPVLISDIISYELIAYLGDAFDLGLMFDLTGRSPLELFVVSSAHLVMPAVLTASAVGLTALAVVVTHKRFADSTVRLLVSPAIPVGMLVLGSTVHTWARTSNDVLDDALRRKPSGRFLGMVIEGLTDLDRDGYGILRQPRDPSWLDRAVYPYAVDWPGNGVDENGLAGDHPADTPAYHEEAGQAPQFATRPDVVLVVLESFRADAVGAILNGRPVTPTLDGLARGGVAARAYSHNGYTTRSRRHLLTGSLGGIRGENTLIDDFKANGYEVAYISGQDESFGGEELSVHTERADVFYDARQDRARRYTTYASPGSLAVSADVVLERVQRFLKDRNRVRPLFLYVNFHDTHFPYWHERIQPLVDPTVLPQGRIVPARAAELRRMYMNTAANVDAAIGRLLSDVRASLGREPAIIVTADHGESLFDEGFLGHGYALNDAQTAISLIVSGLAMDIVEPFAQSSIRTALWRALSREPGAAVTPSVRTSDSSAVFQYLGSLERPRQIALTWLHGQDVYDFRANRAKIRRGGWKDPAALTPEEGMAFNHLVRFWERLRLAGAKGKGVAGNDKSTPDGTKDHCSGGKSLPVG